MGSSPRGLLGCKSRTVLRGLLPASCLLSLYRQPSCLHSWWEMGSSYVKAISFCQVLSSWSAYSVFSEGCLGTLLLGCLLSRQLGHLGLCCSSVWCPAASEPLAGLLLLPWPCLVLPASLWHGPLHSPVASVPDYLAHIESACVPKTHSMHRLSGLLCLTSGLFCVPPSPFMSYSVLTIRSWSSCCLPDWENLSKDKFIITVYCLFHQRCV